MSHRLIVGTILTLLLFTIVIFPSQAQGPQRNPGQPLPQGQPEQPLPRGQPGQPLPQGQPAQPIPQGQPLPQVHTQTHSGEEGDLQLGFYAKTCPNVENVVADVVKRFHQGDQKIPAVLVRLLFHDCFVKGCDASILLDESPVGLLVEKAATSNGKTLNKGYQVIDEIKGELEKQCPRTVSCADIIAFAAREAVILAGLPRYDVHAGRRDGTTSRGIDADEQLPSAKQTLPELKRIFGKKGFSLEDMVVLSGAHSIGESRCNHITDRLYKFGVNMPRDPNMDPAFADALVRRCPEKAALGEEGLVEFDPVTPLKLDNQYYLNLQQKKGLLASDQLLANDPTTTQFVNQMAANNDAWGQKFVNLMVKMGTDHYIAGQNGQIRINCRAVNPN